MVATLKEAFGDLYKDSSYSEPCSYLPHDLPTVPNSIYFYFDKSTKKCIQLLNHIPFKLKCPPNTYINVPKNLNVL